METYQLHAGRAACLFLVVGVLTSGGCSMPFGNKSAALDSQTAQSPGLLEGGRSARASRDNGLRLAAEQRDDEAVRAFEQARELAPGMKGVSHPLAVLYDRQGEWSAAAREYRRALKESPKDADLLNDYGYFLYSQGEFTQSEELLRRALKLKSQHSKAQLNLALVLAAEDRIDEAFAAFEASVGKAAAHHNIGLLLSRSGRQDEGMAHLRSAVELDPSLDRAKKVIAQLEAQPSNSVGSVRHVSADLPNDVPFQFAD